MAKPRHYSPVISRFLVSVLYHEAKAQHIPMTHLVNDLLRKALSGSESWERAQETRVAEDPPTIGAGIRR